MREPVQIDFEYIFMGADHNLMCWVCNKRKAVYNMYPVWVFQPCWQCNQDIGGEVVRKRPWFRNLFSS
jgi:hypothetical protein